MEGAEQHRGLPSKRALKDELYELALRPTDLEGQSVLNVGVGYGVAMREILEMGIDVYGVDIIPRLDLSRMNKARARMLEDARVSLEKLETDYPGHIKAADATQSLPYEDSSMDYVLASYSVPFYAHDAEEIVKSITEMVRVSRKKVAVTTGWDKEKNPEGIIRHGSFRHEKGLGFKYAKFLDELSECGVKWELKFVPGKGLGEQGGYCLHIDTSQKDNQKLAEKVNNMLESPERFLGDIYPKP